MFLINDQSRIEIRKKLRAEAPICEKILWERLRRKQLGAQCRRQVSIGNYVVDLCFLDQRLIIECDGVQHEEQIKYDKKRTEYLEKVGFRVLRYWNHDIVQNIDSVVQQIFLQLQTPPRPSPQRGGRRPISKLS